MRAHAERHRTAGGGRRGAERPDAARAAERPGAGRDAPRPDAEPERPDAARDARPEPPVPDMSPSDAASRLRYMDGVRARARRALLVPAFVAVALGAVVVAHGALIALWPHGALLSIAWIACLIAARPGLVWQRRRLERRRGLLGRRRLRVACAVAGSIAAVAAVVASADPLVSAAAASVALAAYLGDVPAVAIAALVAGVAGEMALADGASRPVGELLAGAGLVGAGLVYLAAQRQTA